MSFRGFPGLSSTMARIFSGTRIFLLPASFLFGSEKGITFPLSLALSSIGGEGIKV
jgi:hypothetical protein